MLDAVTDGTSALQRKQKFLNEARKLWQKFLLFLGTSLLCAAVSSSQRNLNKLVLRGLDIIFAALAAKSSTSFSNKRSVYLLFSMHQDFDVGCHLCSFSWHCSSSVCTHFVIRSFAIWFRVLSCYLKNVFTCNSEEIYSTVFLGYIWKRSRYSDWTQAAGWCFGVRVL